MGWVSKKTAVIILLALLVCSCSATKTMNGIMSSWTGSDLDEVVALWGPPHEVRDSGKNKLYVWHHTTAKSAPKINIRTTSISGHTGSSGSTTAGGGTTYGSCQRILEIDPNGKVVNWQWSGDSCPYREDGPYANWRKAAPES